MLVSRALLATSPRMLMLSVSPTRIGRGTSDPKECRAPTALSRASGSGATGAGKTVSSKQWPSVKARVAKGVQVAAKSSGGTGRGTRTVSCRELRARAARHHVPLALQLIVQVHVANTRLEAVVILRQRVPTSICANNITCASFRLFKQPTSERERGCGRGAKRTAAGSMQSCRSG